MIFTSNPKGIPVTYPTDWIQTFLCGDTLQLAGAEKSHKRVRPLLDGYFLWLEGTFLLGDSLFYLLSKTNLTLFMTG